METAPVEVRAGSKDERVEYLSHWCLAHPLATIEEARQALRDHFNGTAVGTKLIADTLREARRLRIEGSRPEGGLQPPASQQSLQEQAQAWAQQMRNLGVRLIEVLEDGGVRVELTARH